MVSVFYLTRLGFSTSQTGIVLTHTLVGDTAVSLDLTPLVRVTNHARQVDRLCGEWTLVAPAPLKP